MAPGGTTYSVTQLNFATNTYSALWTFGTETASAPSTYMNAFAYNPVDGIVYGVFESASTAYYLCRIDATPNSQDCLCQLGSWFNSGTITADGTFYMSNLGNNLHKLANVQNLVSPSAPSSANVASLSSCGETQLCSGTACRATSPSPYVPTAWALTGADLVAAYDLPTSCSSQCYMLKWTYNSGTDSEWFAPRSPRACV